jgi:2-keto-3-deoxy-L-rhamnonate aldolase RhmA
MSDASLRSRLLTGELLVGVTTNMESVDLVEVFAACGYDWLMIDAEHGALDDRTIGAMLRASAAAGLPAVVRVRDLHPKTVLRVCDLGADGVLGPQVDNAAAARDLVAAARYPPHGIRGLHPATRSSRWGSVPAQEHMRLADARTCVIAQIESVAALDDLEGILAVPGLDAVLVGPRDLALSMSTDDPDGVHGSVEEATAAVFAAAGARGVACGSAAYDMEVLARLAGHGGTLWMTGFLDVLHQGLSARVRAVREAGAAAAP